MGELGQVLGAPRPCCSPSLRAATLEILVLRCCTSALFEGLYDEGFRRITNVDFLRVVVTDMCHTHVARDEVVRHGHDRNAGTYGLRLAVDRDVWVWLDCCRELGSWAY